MRCVVQRVSHASVSVDGCVVGAVQDGLLILLGITHADTVRECETLARKVAGLRVFEDADGKMNLALREAGGSVLAISQFTLYADVRKGRRPSFTDAARPEQAQPLYEHFCQALRVEGLQVETGKFGAHMKIALENDGPVTIVIDTDDLA